MKRRIRVQNSIFLRWACRHKNISLKTRRILFTISQKSQPPFHSVSSNKVLFCFLVKNFRLHGDSFLFGSTIFPSNRTRARCGVMNFVRYALLRISGNVLKLPSIILSCILLLVMSLTSFWFFGWNLGCYPSADQIDQYHVLGQIRRAMRRF